MRGPRSFDPDLAGERHRFRRDRDVHAAQQLVDCLDDRTLARPLADMDDLAAERIEHGADPTDVGRRCRRHNGKGAGRGAGDAARHRRVDQDTPGRRDTGGDILDGAGRAGRHKDDDCAPRQGVERAAVEEHRPGLVCVHHHQDQSLCVLRRLGRRRDGDATRGLKCLSACLAHVEAAHREAVLYEVRGHGPPHRAEADKTDGSEIATHVRSAFTLGNVPRSLPRGWESSPRRPAGGRPQRRPPADILCRIPPSRG